MNLQALKEMAARAEYEYAELLNSGGRAFTAMFRLTLVIGMLALLGMACLIGLLDEQLQEKKASVVGSFH